MGLQRRHECYPACFARPVIFLRSDVMTAEQFRALCTLLRSPPGPAQEAARLVLVGQVRQVDAAALAGVSAASVSHAVARIRRGHELAKIAVS